MSKNRIFQIFYNEATRLKLDPGFIPLRNSNSRPDWFEYIPIRNCLLNENFGNDEYIGIFSPKFFEKTGMTSQSVKERLEKSTAPVVSFSPWYAHIVLHDNVFMQAESNHPGSMIVFEKILPRLNLSVNPRNCITGSNQAIFCNYFVAKKWVWMEWLALTNTLYDISENDDSFLGRRLRESTTYNKAATYQMKIFILERIISAWLISNNIKADFCTDKSTALLGLDNHNDPLTIDILDFLDNEKCLFASSGDTSHLTNYKSLRSEFLANINQAV